MTVFQKQAERGFWKYVSIRMLDLLWSRFVKQYIHGNTNGVGNQGYWQINQAKATYAQT